LASSLLAAHSKWDWRAIALEVLQPFEHIEQQQLDAAVESCNDNGTMYCQRMQVSTSQMASRMASRMAALMASRVASRVASDGLGWPLMASDGLSDGLSECS
jgi:hypothetical protein